MRVIGGTLRGRVIPFINNRYDNADITSQMVKEAVFDILSARIKGASFLDLFSCSGQIGLEAFSRGAAFVLMNEKDRRRLSFIRKLKDDFSLGDTCEITGFDFARSIRYCRERGLLFDIIYADPPYVKSHAHAPIYDEIVMRCGEAGILRDDGIIITQHYIHNRMKDSVGQFEISDTRTYGQNVLTFYARASTLDGV
jgi:16S rRNA (guanine966-N2)-methyltransferase